MRIEKCDKCHKRYSVIEIGGGMPGTKESEEITCPHCGNTFTERSNGAFKTTPLPDEADSPNA
jgi:transposase-like protein